MINYKVQGFRFPPQTSLRTANRYKWTNWEVVLWHHSRKQHLLIISDKSFFIYLSGLGRVRNVINLCLISWIVHWFHYTISSWKKIHSSHKFWRYWRLKREPLEGSIGESRYRWMNLTGTGENWRTPVTVFLHYASVSRVTLSVLFADRQTEENSFIKSTSTRKFDPPYTLLPCGVECTCVNVVKGGESGERIKWALQKSDKPIRCPYFKSPDL